MTVRPIAAVYGADDAPRLSRQGQLVISFHSRGPAGSVLRLKESYLPPYYTADRMGYSGFSELALYPERFAAQLAAVDPKAAAHFVADLKEQVVATNLSKYSQRALGAVNLPETYVFMPLQTVDDPVAGLCVVPQLDALEWLLETTAALGWGAVVKRHPLCRSKEVETRLELLAQRHAHLLHSEPALVIGLCGGHVRGVAQVPHPGGDRRLMPREPVSGCRHQHLRREGGPRVGRTGTCPGRLNYRSKSFEPKGRRR